MKVLTLAAGRGSRLAPLTDVCPKAAVPFAGRALLEWQMAAFAGRGVAGFDVVVGHKREALDQFPVTPWVNARWAETNMVHSLMTARPLLEAGEALVVVYGDIVVEPRVLDALFAVRGDIVVTVDRDWLDLWTARRLDPYREAETLRLDAAGNICDIGRPLTDLRDAEAQYMGLLRFTPRGLRALLDFHDAARADAPWLLGRTLEAAYMTDLLRGMAESGITIAAAPVRSGWLEFDSVQDMDLYTAMHANGELKRFFDTEAFCVPA